MPDAASVRREDEARCQPEHGGAARLGGRHARRLAIYLDKARLKACAGFAPGPVANPLADHSKSRLAKARLISARTSLRTLR
ncbi:MAG: hypothetical protein PF443_00095, partial [Allgaiera sp.]|nr:hypothetical protein [Allgaiera sp.]